MSMEKIKLLREKTNAGIVDCKKALEQAGGDIDKAQEILRKQGIAKAAKRADRQASEGFIKVAVNEAGTEGYIAEFNAETDFVARNESFIDFSEKVFALIKQKQPANQDQLFALEMDDGQTVGDALKNLSGVIGEKLDIKRFAILKAPTVAAYLHAQGRIGALVGLDKEGKKDLAYDIAMQVAAANPKYINREQVPAEEIEKEKEIYVEQLKKEGKPEQIIDKIVQGKLNKFYQEVCLVDQEYIKDDKKRVSQILGDIGVVQFIRYSL